MLSEKSIVKLSKNILKRYETSIDNGALILFNVETEEFWIGNKSSNDLIKLLDGKKNLQKIYKILHKVFFEDYSYNEIKKSFDSLIIDLIDKNFFRIAWGIIL